MDRSLPNPFSSVINTANASPSKLNDVVISNLTSMPVSIEPMRPSADATEDSSSTDECPDDEIMTDSEDNSCISSPPPAFVPNSVHFSSPPPAPALDFIQTTSIKALQDIRVSHPPDARTPPHGKSVSVYDGSFIHHFKHILESNKASALNRECSSVDRAEDIASHGLVGAPQTVQQQDESKTAAFTQSMTASQSEQYSATPQSVAAPTILMRQARAQLRLINSPPSAVTTIPAQNPEEHEREASSLQVSAVDPDLQTGQQNDSTAESNDANRTSATIDQKQHERGYATSQIALLHQDHQAGQQNSPTTGSSGSSRSPVNTELQISNHKPIGSRETNHSPAVHDTEILSTETTGSNEASQSPGQDSLPPLGSSDSYQTSATTGLENLNPGPTGSSDAIHSLQVHELENLGTKITELNDVNRSPRANFARQGALQRPLRSAMVRQPVPPGVTMLGMLQSQNVEKKKSLLHMVMSKVGMKQRRSPLREAFSNGNARKALAGTPRNARFLDNPVTGTKKYVKDEAISYPSPVTSQDENSFLSHSGSLHPPVVSPTQEEQDAMIAAQLISPSVIASHEMVTGTPGPLIEPQWTRENDHDDAESSSTETSSGAVSDQDSANEASTHKVESTTPRSTWSEDPKTPQRNIARSFGELSLSARRRSERTREREEEKERLRAEEAAIAAAERDRKEKAQAEERARIEKEEAEEKARVERVLAEEKARQDQAEAEARKRKEAEEEEERKKNARRMPVEKVIQSLTEDWDAKVTAALAQGLTKQVAANARGNPITRRDIGFVLPQPRSGDNPSGWLNDVIIEAYLLAVVDHANRDQRRGQIPKQHAFNNFFYNNLKDGAVDKVLRWTKRAKMGGKDLLQVEWVFIPVNVGGAHWTLLAVSPTRKTIEYFDSLHGSASNPVRNIKVWLKAELGSAYNDEEWKVLEDPLRVGKGKGPSQSNSSDCGVFTVTTAKMVSLGVDPMAVSASDMPMQRRRLVAELLHGSFTGEFEPKIVFE